ncbi:MAG TPA: GtrA family protein [Chthoniobacterales bacterium]|jgi:putative flippase GtrA|nr:GtrA family protein [Chthoniobacterales bacterium]
MKWVKAGFRDTRRELIAFILVGGANTGLTYLLYLALLRIASYPLAYSASFVAGIFLSYYLNARFVFKAPLRIRQALQYPAVYVVQYLLGLGLLYLLVERIRLSPALAPLLIVVLTIPVTFVLSRYVIRGPAKPDSSIT